MPPTSRPGDTLYDELVSASFAESSAPLQLVRLGRAFHQHPRILAWLEGTWSVRRAAIGALLREHIRAQWPAFDWDGAYGAYRRVLEAADAPGAFPSLPAVQALSLYEASRRAEAFYDALAQRSALPRAIALFAAQEHADFHGFLGAGLRRFDRRGGFQPLAAREFEGLHAARPQD